MIKNKKSRANPRTEVVHAIIRISIGINHDSNFIVDELEINVSDGGKKVDLIFSKNEKMKEKYGKLVKLDSLSIEQVMHNIFNR